MPTHVLGAAGVPKAKFWDMWEVCYGCDYIVLHLQMNDHGCDLTIGEQNYNEMVLTFEYANP